MANKNLGIRFDHPGATSYRVKYARIDNIQIPSWVTVSPDPTVSPAILAQNIDNGQYQIETIPIYPDNRHCEPTIRYTAACEGLISINAYIQSENLVVEAFAPSSVPKIRITVDYPNGGQHVANYVNDGNDIVIALPTSVNGDFFVSGQSVCDEDSGFYSPASNIVAVTRNSSPTITQVSDSDTGPGGTRTQIFTIGPTVTAGNRYVLTVYSHDITVTAVLGDTPSSIANKLKDAINATTEGDWNDHGSAPASGTPGFKPSASSSGNQVIIVLNYNNSFVANAYVS